MPTKTFSARTVAPFFAMLMSFVVGCSHNAAPVETGGISEAKRQDLLIGYGLLSDTLKDESKLSMLEVFKKVMFDAPNESISKQMKTLSEASERRGDQLAKLRQQAPRVTDKPDGNSAIGDAINDIAKDVGKSEMLSRNGGFDVRFVLLQAQATRMVAAISKAIARFEPNAERKAWLKDVAAEYEGYRGGLIRYLDGEPSAK